MAVTAPTGLSFLARLKLLSLPLRLMLLAVLLSALGILALSEFTVREALDDTTELTRMLEQRTLATAFKALMVDVETAKRGYLLTGDPASLEPYETARRDLQPTALRLRQVLPVNSPLHQRLNRMNSLVVERMGHATAIINLYQNGKRDEALQILQLDRGGKAMGELLDEFAAFDAQASAALRELSKRQQETILRSRIALVLATGLLLGLLFLATRLAVGQAVQEKEEIERMKAQVAVRTAELTQLSAHLQSVSEREKAELARNLHDEMGGLLTAAKMDLSWLQGALAGSGPAIREKLDQLNEGLGDAMNVKRRVVDSLRPALLDHFGLPTALKSYFDETCRKAGLDCETDIPDDLDSLSDDLSIAIFRVGQESLTNIIRHARATRVRMSMQREGDILKIVIADDGCGYDLQRSSLQPSHGVNGMRHRVEGLGGDFAIASAPGSGTQVRLAINTAIGRGAGAREQSAV